MTEPLSDAAIASRNVRAFLWFRVLFNSRFYYPVFTILFLDFGLTLEEFAILNMVWAASIVIFEVPSGALADKLGRKHLVVFSSLLMVAEMLLLCLMPANAGRLTFYLFLLNRVISGLAEACCSGADEALVYDALPAAGRSAAWTRVLASLMRWQSVTFMIVALIGAASYSQDFVNRLPGMGHLSKEACMRIPLWLNLAMAVATVASSLLFIDTHPRSQDRHSLGAIVKASFAQMAATGLWIMRSPAAVVLILTGLLYDSFTRLFYSVGSNYYRLLGIDESYNGVILAGSSVIGLGTAMVVEKLVGILKPSQNLGMVAGLIFAGLSGIAMQITAWHGWAGVLFVVPFWLAMRSLHYFLSQYLNSISDSAHRATVLSFKGLSMNLAYGLVMWLYGIQTAWLRKENAPVLEGLGKEQTDVKLLSVAMPWWPWIFGSLALLLVLFVHMRYRKGLTALIEDRKTSTLAQAEKDS
ncbi:MAG TPA: MFS transporter [Verrucomicrobiales bacterium]|nr:MFS transporter [Verrucomicrobiales bacterium]